jgi:acetyl-CoA decarbonylase/synthase complex subunit gamma
VIARILEALLQLELAPLPYDVMMESFPPGMLVVGKPDESSPVMVTCNFRKTVEILETILNACNANGYLVMSDTKGYSVDNAIVEKRFTPFEILKVINTADVGASVQHRKLIIPGLAGSLAAHIRQVTGWEIIVGPVSGMELPLFLQREGLAWWDDS